LPDFYVCKTWSHIFVLREEITLRLLECRVLRKVFAFKRKYQKAGKICMMSFMNSTAQNLLSGGLASNQLICDMMMGEQKNA